MKKNILFVMSLVFSLICYAQEEVILDKSLVIRNSPKYPYGINIDMNISGRWAREFNFSHNGKGDLFSFGAVANNGKLEYGYIGGNDTDNFNINYQKPWMVFLPNGNIGIATVSPQYLLDVNGIFRAKEVLVSGSIKAREVKIEISAGADFVFSEDYNLKPLSEVESFVKENQHLPEIPSEKEMQENGLNLNDMQIKLLQKIEELTLYVIDLKKENESIKQELKALRK